MSHLQSSMGLDHDETVKVWLITGTSSGFGRRLVSSVLARGDRVIATARSLDRILDLTAEELDSGRLKLLSLDVNDGPDVIFDIVAQAAGFWGRIDVVVNNAGVGLTGILEESGSRQFKTNVYGLLNVTIAVLPYMRERKSGTVVLIGSRSAWRTETPGIGSYGASKAAAHAIGETLSTELAPFSIRVLIVEPGTFKTEGIYSEPFYTANPIPCYDEVRAASHARFEAVYGNGPSSKTITERGDPVKAMEAVVDVVRGEGKAVGREWPLWLILGQDACENVRERCLRMLALLDEWKDVSENMRLED